MNELVTQHNISRVRQDAVRKLRGEEGAASTRPDMQLDDLNRQSKLIQELLERLESLPDPKARALAREAMQAVLKLYGDGLARIFELLSKATASAETACSELLHDNVVRGLLMIHGLYPIDLETRLREALAKIRPYLESHGGNVEMVSLQDGVARLRLQGTCHGCPSSALTLELALKSAIEQACPDLLDLQVEGVVEPPAPGLHLGPGAPRWTILDGFGSLRDGEMKPIEVAGAPVIVCNVQGSLYAYHNECPACGLSLESGALENGFLRCRLGHRFDVRLAGRCPDNDDVHLEPLPLLAEGAVVKVSVR